MGPDLYNIYVENMISEIVELTKTKLLLVAQLQHQQKLAAELNDKVIQLEAALDKAKSKKKSDSEF